jgi:FMN phosphatase YigB (HAD superfamily)
VKPDAEIFELLIEQTGLEPARALFIDDSADNIAAAKRIGFDTVLFKTDETDLRTKPHFYAPIVSRA